jgi:hypothetical protein
MLLSYYFHVISFFQRECDKNIKLFHWVTNSNRRCIMIEKLVINGDISSKTILSNFSLNSLLIIRWGPHLDGLFTLLVKRRPLGWSEPSRKGRESVARHEWK